MSAEEPSHLVGFKERAIITLAPLIGGSWVRARRRKYLKHGLCLTQAQHAALLGYYSGPLLTRVRVAVVERIESPAMTRLLPFGSLRRITDLSTVRGMAFGDAIVTRREPSLSLRFHELVHVVQYDLYGIGPMLKRYVGDYFRSGRDYLAIDAEHCAYELQARFENAPGQPFDVATEVRRMMG